MATNGSMHAPFPGLWSYKKQFLLRKLMCHWQGCASPAYYYPPHA